jgi:pyruvyltransferase
MVTNNFGDDLNPYIFEYLSGRKPEHVKEDSNEDCYILIGSILNWSKSNNICWGAGFAYDCGDIGLKGKIELVRGPFSRKVVLNNGLGCQDEYFGDPAILISQFYKPRIDKKYKLGILPHIVDYDRVIVNNPDIIKINLKQNYKTIINQILSCEKVISSSLHGLIVADAYEIPSAWVEFSDNVIGGGFKFLDYYKSIGVDDPVRLNLRDNTEFNLDNILTKIEKYDNLQLVDNLMKNCPFKNQK